MSKKTGRSSSESRSPNGPSGTTMATIIVAALGVVSAAIVAYLQFVAPQRIAIEATLTAEARRAMVTPTVTRSPGVSSTLAPTATSAPAPTSTAVVNCLQTTCLLRIQGIELFPPSDTAKVQVSAFVNGTEFRYPSLGGVEWLEVAPTMSGQTFKLPHAEQYEVRFEMRKRAGPQAEVARLLSQETVLLKTPPATGVYALHGFDPASMTRAGTTSAQVMFSFEVAP